ncbi:MAG TPA: hypothetical protein PK156_07765 [Polyangium sp.]|nr:hypothetical protein [Polyangium sp.]
MPLGPMDDFLAHQTPETFDHVYTGDRAFYDRYYFNCHSCSDEIFLITGMGQYPNLGVLDAFVTVSLGDKHYCVRASRELGHDRLNTSVGPFSVEVVKGLETLGIASDDTSNEELDSCRVAYCSGDDCIVREVASFAYDPRNY